MRNCLEIVIVLVVLFFILDKYMGFFCICLFNNIPLSQIRKLISLPWLFWPGNYQYIEINTNAVFEPQGNHKRYCFNIICITNANAYMPLLHVVYLVFTMPTVYIYRALFSNLEIC